MKIGRNLNEEPVVVIRMCLLMDVASFIVNKTSAMKLMEALTNMYEKPSANSKTHILKKYFNIQMAENFYVDSYINEVITLITHLNSVKIEFTDEVYGIELLMSLPESWETMITVVSNSIGDNTLKFSTICYLAIAKEIHKKDNSK